MPRPTIGFLTYDWSFGLKPIQPNGCAWYRCYLPMQQLKKDNMSLAWVCQDFHQNMGMEY